MQMRGRWVCGGFHLPMNLHKHSICNFRIAHNFYTAPLPIVPYPSSTTYTCESVIIFGWRDLVHSYRYLGFLVVYDMYMYYCQSLSPWPSISCCLWRICDMKTVCVHMICTIVQLLLRRVCYHHHTSC